MGIDLKILLQRKENNKWINIGGIDGRDDIYYFRNPTDTWLLESFLMNPTVDINESNIHLIKKCEGFDSLHFNHPQEHFYDNRDDTNSEIIEPNVVYNLFKIGIYSSCQHIKYNNVIYDNPIKDIYDCVIKTLLQNKLIEDDNNLSSELTSFRLLIERF